MTAVTEPLYQIIAKRDPETGGQQLGDCILHTGYGSVELKFGQSAPDVPETVALALKGRADIMVIKTDDVGVPPAALELPEGERATAAREAQAAADAAEAAALVASGKATQAEGDGTQRFAGPNGEIIVLSENQIAAIVAQFLTGGLKQEEGQEDAAKAAKVAAAREHLKEEPVEIPKLAPTPQPIVDATTPLQIPQGFELQTSEGQDRCLARKADGGQCKNAATENRACALDAHQTQLKARVTPDGA